MKGSELIQSMIWRARDDPAVSRRVRYLTAACLVILTVALIKPARQDTHYILNENGDLIALDRGESSMQEFYVELTVEGEDGAGSRSLVLIPGRNAVDPAVQEQDSVQNEKLIREAEINGIVSDIEYSGESRVDLPTELSDGTRLHWKAGSKHNNEWMYIPLMYLILIPIVVFGTRNPEETKRMQVNREIVRRIPRFTNQLLLLLNAGLVLNDAFSRISQSYAILPPERRGAFEREIIERKRQCDASGAGPAAAIAGVAADFNVKELMRIAAFMNENEKRGSDIVESLSRESEFLWEERKTKAKEQGKAIDTKMAYPLAMLLLLLIVITMAPAMLSM
ncbi:MAG: type II secretion system F family protein [Mogibacterium sp.]|nr:type II secretion system F family protein [Mogibacterium sp.]